MRYDERVAATKRTFDEFAGCVIDHAAHDCGKMLIAHLRNMERGPKIGPGGTWKSIAGLKRFLNAHGGSGAACLDGWGLVRIPPAATIVGDIVEMEGEWPGAFGVCLGNGRVLCWAEHEEARDTAVVFAPNSYVAAWRV